MLLLLAYVIALFCINRIFPSCMLLLCLEIHCRVSPKAVTVITAQSRDGPAVTELLAIVSLTRELLHPRKETALLVDGWEWEYLGGCTDKLWYYPLLSIWEGKICRPSFSEIMLEADAIGCWFRLKLDSVLVKIGLLSWSRKLHKRYR